MTGPALDPESGRLVVVGGGLATARVCAAARRKKFAGTITVVGAESHPPYDRPPLSKDVLHGKRDSTPLPFDTDKLRVDLVSSTRAVGLDPVQRTIALDSGTDLPYDGLVIATGADPIRLPGPGPQLTLHTIDDALGLRESLLAGARVVVIGASWIGAEVATAAVAAGCRVTCLELGAEPLSGPLGDEVGRATRPWWDGIDLRTGVRVASVEEGGVLLDDGEIVPADVVVTGIGVRPDLAWLRDSGLDCGTGVRTDTRCRTTLPGVVAIGDVAERWSDRTGSHRILGHWDEAGTAATAAICSLLGLDGPEHDPVPYFWSDQLGHSLQYVGAHGPADEVRVATDDRGALTGATWRRDGLLTAWLGVDSPGDLVRARTSVGGPADAWD